LIQRQADALVEIAKSYLTGGDEKKPAPQIIIR
jgi:hypothetical protein